MFTAKVIEEREVITRKIKRVIVHCDANSNPKWGLKELEILHRALGYGGIGYHYWIDFDGQYFNTRSLNVPGTHTKGQNKTTIGVCLHGLRDFRPEQFDALVELLSDLCNRFRISVDKIDPHNKYANKKCPNFDLEPIRRRVAIKLKTGEEHVT